MGLVVAQAADWSFANHNPQDIKNAGYAIGLRYLGNDARCIDIPERNAFYASGLRLSVIGQAGSVTRPRSGYPGGRSDGLFFQAEADELDWPNGKPILCAIADVGAGFPTENDIPVIKEYFRGLYDSISPRRPVGIYGPYFVLEAFRGDPRVFCFWQTAGGSGSGSGTGGSAFNPGDGSWRRLSSLACMYQQYGGELVPQTDHNQIFEASLNWSYHPSDNDQVKPKRGKKKNMTVFQVVETKDDSLWAEEVFFESLRLQGKPIPGVKRHTFVMWDSYVRHLETPEEVENYKIAAYVEAVDNSNNPDPYFKPSYIIRTEPMEDRWFSTQTLVPHDMAGFPQPMAVDVEDITVNAEITDEDKEDISQRTYSLVHADLAD